MSWLVSTKVAPRLMTSDRPTQTRIQVGKKDIPKDYLWEILWKDRPIGTAKITVEPGKQGKATTRSHVDFQKLPMREISTELFGNFGMLMKMLPLKKLDVQTRLQVQSVSHFDAYGALDRLASNVELEDVGEVIRMEARVADGQLHFRVLPGPAFFSSDEQSAPPALFSKSFDLPEDANVTNWLAPESRFKNVAVGQEWEYQVYRAIPPNNPYRTVKAMVVGKEILPWEGEAVPVFVIELRDVTGTLTATRTDVSRMFVDDSGDVLRQELAFGKSELVFVRKAAPKY